MKIFVKGAENLNKMIIINIKTKLSLCWKIINTKAFSEDYTIRELIEDEF